MNKIFDREKNSAILLAGILSIVVGVGISRFVFTSLLPAMLQSGLSISFAGLLASLNFAGYMGGSLLSIFIKDINQKVLLFRLGIILSVCTTAVLGVTRNETVWIIARIIGGFGGAMALVVGSAIVMTKLNMENKTKAMGIHFSGIGFSIVVTDLISRITFRFGGTWENAWIVLSLFGAVFSIYILYILSFSKEVKQKVIKHKLNISIFTPFVLLFIFAYFTEGIGFVVQATFLPDIINNIQGLKGFGNFTWTLVGLAGIPSSIIWLRLAHRFGSIDVIIIALALQIVGIIIPIFSNNIYLNLLSGIFYGGTFVGLVGLFMNFGGTIVKNNPVVIMGALTTFYGVGQIIAPLYSIYFIHKYGNYTIPLYLTAFIVIIGICSLFLAKKRYLQNKK